jgi:hypothetical protein
MDITTRWERQVEASPAIIASWLSIYGALGMGKTPDSHSLLRSRSGRADRSICRITLVGFAMAVSAGALPLPKPSWPRPSGSMQPRFFTAPDWPYGLFGDFGPSLDEFVFASGVTGWP